MQSPTGGSDQGTVRREWPSPCQVVSDDLIKATREVNP